MLVAAIPGVPIHRTLNSAVRAEPAFLPRSILLEPDVSAFPAPEPNATLLSPEEVGADKLLLPMAQFPVPVALESALCPMAEFNEFAVTDDKAANPAALFEYPVVQELKAVEPMAVPSFERGAVAARSVWYPMAVLRELSVVNKAWEPNPVSLLPPIMALPA